MVVTISGRIESKDASSATLGGCRVDVYYDPNALAVGTERPRLNSLPNDTDSGKTPLRAGRASARTDQQGRFTIPFPDNTTSLGNTLHFIVVGPAGQTIGEASTPVKDAFEKLVIPVNTKDIDAIPLDQPQNPIEPATRRVNGRVYDRDGKPTSAGLQVIVIARKFLEEGVTPQDMPILVVRTDGSGYFFGEVPNQRFEHAAALVAGIKTEILIALDDGFIPKNIPLVLEFPAESAADNKAKDCGCGTTPRTPGHADFNNAPNSFSNDLGTGNCVQFTTPNRAIEEFDFYSVVRTTEPDIVAFNATGAKPAGMTRSDLVLASLEAAAAAAATNAAAAKALMENLGKSATQTQTTSPEAQALKLAFESPIVAAARAEVYTALFARNDAGWTAQTARDKLTTTLITGHIAPATALQMAQLLIDAVVAVTPAKLSGSEIWNATDRIMSAAAESARARAAVVTAMGTSASIDLTAAQAKYAEAQRAVTAALAAVAAKKAELVAQALSQSRRSYSKPTGRVELSVRHPIDWDDTPTFYQAAEIAHGHLLHFKQVWYADGYSLGDLLYSLPLAPGQKKLISVIDWDRRERNERSESTSSEESVSASLSRDRDLGEVVTGTLSESSRGGSKSTTAGVGVGTGAAGNGSYQGFNFGALIGVSGGYGEANSSAWQDSTRNLSSSSLQNLRDRTLQSASAVRGIRSTVVQTVSQGESVRATTEVVANHNHCHAMTVQYFEVLRHLKLQHELADVQECLFVPLPMSEFDLDKTLRWRQELRTYLQRPQLAGGFDAARRVSTNWSQVDAPLERYSDEFIQSLTGELLITVLVPLPPFPERPRPNPADTAADTAQAIADAVNPTTGFLGVVLAIATGGASLVAGAATGAAINASKAAANGARAVADELYAINDPQERYKKYHQEIVPGVVEGFINQLDLYARVGSNVVQLSGVDFTLVSEYQPGVPLSISLRATLGGQYKRSDINQLIIKSRNGLPRSFRAIVNSATIRYRTPSFEHVFVDDRRVNDDIDPPTSTAIFSSISDFSIHTEGLGKGATLFTPIDEWEQRKPRTEDLRLTGELIEHLNNNFEYYHHAIWWAMDPNRRYMLLDGFYAPGTLNRSVASVVENRLIGIVGNSVVLPVARGVHLNPRVALDEKGNRIDLMELYSLKTPVPPSRVSLPTRGVFAEAVMGSCNSCEDIDDSKFWRWEDSPIDEPPSIDSISTGTRRAEPSPTTPTAFPTPIVSIQTAPSIPDPTGVGEVLTALGKQSFADITGLAGTQANAAAAYSKAVDTALAFGKEASTLAQQAAMLNAKDKALGAIDSAEEEGKIDADEAKKLRLSALKKMVGDTPVDAKASSTADRLAVIDNQEAASGITQEAAAAARERVLKGLDPEEASKNDERGATTEVIRKIPGDSVETVETKDGTGTTTTIKARPAPSVPTGTKFAKVEIKLRVFIPAPAVGMEVPILGANIKAYSGDGRSFQYTGGTSRAEIAFQCTTDPTRSSPLIGSVNRNWGETKEYDTVDVEDVTGKPGWWQSVRVGATPLRVGRLTPTDSNLHVDVIRDNSDQVRFRLKVEGAIPLVIGSPNISAEIMVTVYQKPAGPALYKVEGNHDGFPAYELYVNKDAIYTHDPEAEGQTPLSLFGTGAGEFDIEDKFGSEFRTVP